MGTVMTLWRRDVLSVARGMFGWTLVAGFSASTGTLLLVALHLAEGSIQTLQTLYARALIVALPPLCAFATMRGFAEERRSGTLETLLTAPVSDSQVVWSKFLSALFLIFVALAASLVGFVLYVETAIPAPVYSRTGLASSMVVILLHAAAWTAAGTFTSLSSRHQGVAAVACILLTAPHSLLASGLAPGVLPSGYLDALNAGHVARGVLDTRPVVLCLSFTSFFLFTSVRSLESRRWRL